MSDVKTGEPTTVDEEALFAEGVANLEAAEVVEATVARKIGRRVGLVWAKGAKPIYLRRLARAVEDCNGRDSGTEADYVELATGVRGVGVSCSLCWDMTSDTETDPTEFWRDIADEGEGAFDNPAFAVAFIEAALEMWQRHRANKGK